MATARFEQDSRSWTVALTDIKTAEVALANCANTQVIFDERVPHEVVKLLEGVRSQDADFSAVESSLKDALFPYQKRGVLYVFVAIDFVDSESPEEGEC